MKKILLTQGKFALVDNNDYERVNKYKWFARKVGTNWYAERKCTISRNRQETVIMQRFIMDADVFQIVDHENRNGLDNRRQNLRFCTRSQNIANSRKKKNTISVYKGVCWHKGVKKWMSQIQHRNKNIYIGLFKSEVDAAYSYDKKAIELFGKFANLNFKGDKP